MIGRASAGRHGGSHYGRGPIVAAATVLVVVAVVLFVVDHHGTSSGKSVARSVPTGAATATSAPRVGGTNPLGSSASMDSATETSGLTAATATAFTAPAPPAPPTTAVPVRLTVPAIGVSSSLQPLGLQRNGALESPSQWLRAGWYADGVRPGDPGPAVIAGHVDSTAGPAVFFRLKELKVGDKIMVTDQKGMVRTFVVDATREYPKNSFPSEAVYGPTALPVLRLITCTGDFDYAAHSYVDNLVVSSHLVS